MKILLISAAAMVFAFIKGEDKLTGRWETAPSEKGNVTGVVFKADNTFEGYVNKKPFATGRYTLENDLFTFVDNGCDGRQGIYRVIFFSGNDSLRLQPVADSCDQRKAGMSRLVMGRVKYRP
ncbi:hypothetical protein [Chitinophaga barathri]|uniref:DUF2147 domain-containing protein n=1 Tax=Chitinophaga barathri TaxID=1647451 RepID=A0A3N4MVV3_9BACT|nr:hypothetical protein [Chitinophaga barathri]RPD39523.1 hypothetical protein EG028_20630 [Chitinophaga barathri]